MRLHELELEDFRNIALAALSPGPRATLVYGPNGHGKTNLLEAIYFLATLRPLRAKRLGELPRFGTSSCAVRGVVELGAVSRTISVEIDRGGRTARLDGKKTKDLEDYFGGIAVVAFTPEDLAVIKGGPEQRRRHLDRSVFNRFPAFLGESRLYGRALRSRNRLLREKAPPEMIEAFDPPLAKAAARVVSRRRAFLCELGPRFSETVARLSGGELEARVRYRAGGFPDEGEEGALEVAFLEALAERLSTDRERGFTTLGPHSDRIAFDLNGKPARTYGSQGQQRALILAWKISEIENLSEHLGFQPLLLLDDVSSELDPERNRQLLTYLEAFDGQVILTTTEPSLLLPATGPEARFFSVSEGAFEEVSRERVSPGG